MTSRISTRDTAEIILKYQNMKAEHEQRVDDILTRMMEGKKEQVVNNGAAFDVPS
jgi:hypothetical protein